jgi:LacI family transcriptional regulator
MTDIARRAGVSQSAVSLVLSGHEEKIKRVAPKTAQKIQRIAKQLNFHPNHAARSLNGQPTGVIGAVATLWFRSPVRYPFLARLLDAAEARGLKVLTWQTNDRVERIESLLQESSARGIDGLIYLAFGNDADWPAVAPLLAGLPNVVSVLGDPGVDGGMCVLPDAASGSRLAVVHLHNRGREKIVQVLEDANTALNRQRKQGFLDAHRELGRPLEENQVVIATRGWRDADCRSEYIELADELVRHRGADAIMADDDLGAAMLVRALRELGLRVPEDVAVVGWGNEMLGRYTFPALSTIDYRPQEIVAVALDLLAANVAGRKEAETTSSQQRIMVASELVIRESSTEIGALLPPPSGRTQ